MSIGPALPNETDVVIVGGGVMGTSTAYYLATESDRDVAVIEKDNLAAGSTGDSSANIRFNYGPHETYSRLAWWSRSVYQEFEKLTGQPIAYVECPRVRFADEGTDQGEFIQAGYDVLSSLDIPVERIESAEIAERYPMFPAAASFDFGVVELAAAYSDAVDVTNGFARGARDADATVHTGVTVESVETASGAVTGVETSDGSVACNEVVLAAGPWNGQLAADLGVDLPMIPTREEIFILEPPDEFIETHLPKMPMTRFEDGLWYGRPDFNDGVLIGTHPFPDRPVDPDNYDDVPDEETALEVYDLLEENVPGLVDAEIRGQYCGLYSTTPDHDFILDELGPAGCYITTGFSGHGFKMAPAVGRIMRDLIVDGETEMVDMDLFALDRFDMETEGHGRPVEPL
ncbi:MAG: NAD(P)/FAD-dependent oxidoreductase [Salinirussus sp.]